MVLWSHWSTLLVVLWTVRLQVVSRQAKPHQEMKDDCYQTMNESDVTNKTITELLITLVVVIN